MSDLGISAPVEGAPASNEAAPEATPAADPYAPVVDRVDQLAGQFNDFRQLIDQRLPAPEPDPEPDPMAPWAALMGQPEEAPQYFDAYGQPVELPQAQPGLDMNLLQQAVAAQINQAVTPYQQQLQQMQTQAAHDQLAKEIPQLAPVPEGHPEFAARQAARAETAQAVAASVAHLPEHVGQALASDWKYVATVFKAAEADKRAQGQQPASEAVPSLEAAGGAVPGGNGEKPSYVQSAQTGAWQGLPAALR